jgi:hypothetical protein
MNEGFMEDPGPREPGIDPLIKLLTSEGTPDELAGEAGALAMFRAASAAANAAANSAAASAAADAAANAATDRHARPAVTASPAGTSPPAMAVGPPVPGPPVPGPPVPGPTVPGGPRPATVRPLHAWRRPGRLIAVAALAAAAAVVTAAYTADLPAPVQHVAYRALGFAGVPDAPGRSSQPGGSGNGAAPSGPGSTARTGGSGSAGGQPGSGGSPSPGQSAQPSPPGASPEPSSPAPGRGHSPGGGKSPSPTPTPTPTPSPSSPPPVPAALTISASAVKIIAGDSVSLTGLLTDADGNPVPGQDVTLLQHDAGVPGWQPAGQATTDGTGTATVPVSSLGTDAGFRFRGPNGTHSGHVRVVVVPAVSLTASRGSRPLNERLTVSAPYAIGSDAILQIWAGGTWRTLRSHPIGPAGQVVFGVKLQRHQRIYRVVVPRTVQHARGISNPAIVPARA